MMPSSSDEFTISCDRSRIDIAVVSAYLRNSYWAATRPIEIIRRSIENSLPFGVFRGDTMIGFARVVTDYGTHAYIADVFILDAYRGRGLSKLLMQTILAHPDLQPMRRWILATRDAHGLYRQFGFTELQNPEKWMERTEANPPAR